MRLTSAKQSDRMAYPHFILEFLSSIIALPLQIFIDHCFKFGLFPYALKLAKVTPVYKAGSKLEITNLSSNISPFLLRQKLFEKLIFKRVYGFIDKNSVLLPTQYGFRANSSTIHAALDIVCSSYENIGNNEYTGLIFLDLKKAF